MKITFKILFIIAILGSSLALHALKIAYINSEMVMSKCKDTVEAEATMKSEAEGWRQEMNDKHTALETLKTNYSKREMTLSPDGKKEAQKKIEDMQKEVETLATEIYSENGRAARRSNELLEPILEKIQNAIDKVALDEDVDIIFDTSSGILYAKPSLDITDKIVAELNAIDGTSSTE